MTGKYTKVLFSTLIMSALLSLGVDRLINLAHADDGSVVVPNATALIDLLMTGKYMAAVGAFLIAFVTLVKGTVGARLVPWFKTKAGGYVLGFGSAFLLYLGAAWQSEQPITAGVFLAALAAGWAAAGGWEHLSDLIAWLKPKEQDPPAAAAPPSAPTSGQGAAQAAIVLLVASGCMIGGSLLMQACGPAKHAGAVVIDCTLANSAKTAALLDELKPLLGGEPLNWASIEDKAIAAGETVGGCVLATLVNEFLSSAKVAAVPADQTWQARQALDDARARWGGNITWKTARGDL